MSDEKPIEATNTSEVIQQKLEQLVKRACSDGQLKKRLLNDPEPLLRENGVEIPAGTKPRVLVDKDCVSFEFVRETTGDDAELTESSMSAVVGGLTRPTGKAPMVYMRYTMTNVSL
jgi:hypothetical protein